jgi:subtilisin family serine protease
MKSRPLIITLILLLLFAIFFYFFLGTEPKIVGDEQTKDLPLTTSLDSVMQLNPKYKAQYVYVKGAGYVLKDRRIVLLVGQDTAQNRKADAIKNVEKELESYWKWQILAGDKKIEDLTSKANQTYFDRKIGGEGTGEQIPIKNIFSRILDVFKVADAVIVVQDNAKKCDCDDDLLLLSGPDLHLIETTLNPGNGGEGTHSPSDKSSINDAFLKLPPPEPQAGDGKSDYNSFVVGIIDSGVNSEKFIGSMNNALNYNFLTNDKNINDPNPILHGTKIARIITKNTPNEKISIVGLKAYDENNIGNLYDNLCAIIYSIKHNIKVVNVSWGTSHDKPMPIFEEVLKRAITANMVIVCSAGNKKEDIDVHSYYPACYTDHPALGSHLLTVTSKSEDVCQNMSSSGKKIDLTMKAYTDCNHEIPDSDGNMGKIFEPGTSYAAPYVTADVTKYLLKNPTNFSKSGYINSIQPDNDIKKY